MPLEFIYSQRGNRLLKLNGHLYMRERKWPDGRTAWKCTMYTKAKCLARVQTSKDEVLAIKHQGHNHRAEKSTLIAREIVTALKNRALASKDTPGRLIEDTTWGVSDAICGQLPNVPCLKRTLQRVRQQAKSPPSWGEMEVPQIFKFTTKEKLFLISDSEIGESRLLIFGTTRNLKTLEKLKHWYANTTSEIQSSLFEELHVIHGICNEISLPLVYAFVPKRTAENYLRLFRNLKDMNENLNPETVMADFNNSDGAVDPVVEAMTEVFPSAVIRASFCSLKRRFGREIETEELMQHCGNDLKFYFKMILALAFVPVAKVHETFHYVTSEEHFAVPAKAMPIISYVKNTWLKKPENGGVIRTPSCYNLEFWNCYDYYLKVRPAYVNLRNFEIWHERFLDDIGVNHHPSIWKIFDVIKTEQSRNETEIDRILNLEFDQNQKIDAEDEKLLAVMEEFENYHILDYLTQIAEVITL